MRERVTKAAGARARPQGSASPQFLPARTRRAAALRWSAASLDMRGEQEADRVAASVTSAPGTRDTPMSIAAARPGAGADAAAMPASLHRTLAQDGAPMQPALRLNMEQRFGHDFSGVRVHTGAAAQQSATDINAHAYTSGEHVVFGAGRYAPGGAAGQRLLAHELTHVVQQRQQGAAAPVVMREAAGPEQSWYDRTKWKVYHAIIAGFKKTKNVSINAMRALVPLLPASLQAAVGGILDVVDFMADMVIALMLVIIGMAVGFSEGIVKLIYGLIALLAGLLKLMADWVAAVLGRPDAYAKDVDALLKAIAGIPAGLKATIDNWVERYKKASAEDQVLMGGELIGEIEAFIATFALAGTKAGQATTLTIKGGGTGAAITRGGALALQEAPAVAVTIPAVVPKTLAEAAVVGAQMSILGGGAGGGVPLAAGGGHGSGDGKRSAAGDAPPERSSKVKGPKNASEALEELQVTQDADYAREAAEIGTGIEVIEIQDWAAELATKGYETFPRQRFGKGILENRRLSSYFTNATARPDMIAINEAEKTVIVGDVTARPGTLAKIPGRVGQAEGLHLEKTIEYAKQLKRQLPAETSYKVFAQEIHWQTGTKTKLILIR